MLGSLGTRRLRKQGFVGAARVEASRASQPAGTARDIRWIGPAHGLGSATSQTVSLHFTKMHGLGNDFVVIDARSRPFVTYPVQIRLMGDRHRGIGFDQLLTIHRVEGHGCHWGYAIWNSDGSKAEQCGNGARCVAAWLARAGLIDYRIPHLLQAPRECIEVLVHGRGDVELQLQEPTFGSAGTDCHLADEGGRSAIEVGGSTLVATLVATGNPHAVVLVNDVDAPDLRRIGPLLTNHSGFARGINAGFVQLRDRSHVVLRVHERGAGWTAACGSGAAAAVAALRIEGRVDADVEVALPGGTLHVSWPGPGHALRQRGPAAFVFEGDWPDRETP